MPKLNENVVIVTGASSGIGAALSRLFAGAGARVTLAARRADRLAAVARRCTGEVETVAADLTVAADRKTVVRRTLDRWGRVDILVNNAGLGAYGPFLDTPETEWRRLFEINLFAPVFMAREVVPVMARQRSGLIVNMASIGGLLAHSDKVVHYVASKHALVGFSRALARDLDGTGVRVMAVCPHLTDTEFFSVSTGAEAMAPVIERLKPHLDSPEDVARGVLENLDAGRVIVFPTERPARAYAKGRDI